MEKEVYNSEYSFEKVLYMWLNNNQIRLKGGSLLKYYNIIEKHIIPDLGNINISDISSTIINSFLFDKLNSGRLDRKGGLAPSYVRSMMLIICAAHNFAVEEYMCPPLRSKVNKPIPYKHEINTLSHEDYKKLEMYILNTGFTTTKIGIYISLQTGLRIGEICALSWNDIDFEQRIIHIRHTVARVYNTLENKKKTKLIIDTPKTNSSIRIIPISSALFPVLYGFYKQSSSKYVVSDNTDFVNPRTYDYRYHKILHYLKLSDYNYHSLRHTFATRCIEAGVDVKTLSEILGHSNVSTTLNIYVHSSIELKRIQLEKIVSY